MPNEMFTPLNACPVKCEADLTGINGNGKIIHLCALCALCAFSEAGGEYTLSYLHNNAWTTSIAEALMGLSKLIFHKNQTV